MTPIDAAQPQRIGVLGVGRMGRPIAETLAAAGYAVGAFDIDATKLAKLDAAGVAIAGSAAELAADAEVLVTVLPGVREIEWAMGGGPAAADPGLLQLMKPGSYWLDLSSGDPDLMVRLAQVAAQRGIGAVEAPMGGGVEAASTAALTFFVAGAAPDVAAVLPVLRALGAPDGIHVLGERPGSGQTAKLLANTLWFTQSIAVTEVMLLGARRGIDVGALRSALGASAGGSVFIDEHLDALLAGDYLETFGIDRVVEELDTVSRLAANAATPYELAGLVTSIHRRAFERFGAVDGELLAAKLLEERAGTTLAAELTRSHAAAAATSEPDAAGTGAATNR